METKYIIVLSVVIGAVLGGIIYSIIHSHNRKIVMTYSELYATIKKVNAQFKFENVISELSFSNTCKSKRGLENFDFDKNLQLYIEQRLSYYQDILKRLETNQSLWAEYMKKYSSIESYTSKDVFMALKLKMPYKIFWRHEKSLYTKSMLKAPTRSLSINYSATYTSPAGRNSYRRDKHYSHVDVARIIRRIYDQQEEQARKEAEKQQRAELRRQKVATAQQNEKKQKELLQREESLSQREQEFQAATQGHIYSSQHTTTDAQLEQSDEDISAWVKLKRLKQLYDNGEITYEEYARRRKELL